MPAATNPTRSTPVSAAAGSSGSAPDSSTSSSSSSSNSGFEQPGGQFNNSSAAAADRITIGSIVRCVFESANMDFQGEVIAVEQKKVLMIKTNSTNNRNSLNDIHMVNIAQPNCKIQVLTEKKDPLPDLPSLNIARLNNRLRDQVEKKKKQVMAFKAGVPPAGQRLFLAIGKTIDDVVWNGENISVLKEVTIYPPYRPEDVKGNTDSQALKHVRKIVEKHIVDQQHFQQSPSPSPHRTADPPGSTGAAAMASESSFAAATGGSGGGGNKPHQSSSRPPMGRGASSSNRNSHHTNNNYTQQTHSSPHNKPPFSGNNSNH